MKILIADDNTSKAGRLARVLSDAGLARDDIEIVPSAMQARECLRQTHYDLFVLDLMLPLREEDEPRLETALSLLREISERDTYTKPARIVGFTAFADQIPSADETFRQCLWTIVRYDPTTDAWEALFGRVARYLRSSSDRERERSYDIDLCVVTALPTEIDSVFRLPWGWEDPEPLDDCTFVRRGRFNGSSGAVVAACAPRMGSVASALVTSKLVEAFRPRFVVMTGICAGIRGKAELGDPVLFDPIWEWPSGKLCAGDGGTYLEPSPHQIPVSEFIGAHWAQLTQNGVLCSRIAKDWPAHKPAAAPTLRIGPAASGSAVVADGLTLEGIQQQHRKLMAVDMDAYGVCAAARYCASPRPTALVIKSVCDFADETKSDEWQRYACYTSAAAMAAFFERYFDSIREFAGN